MKINKAHCLFEQSGTFKKEFIALGIDAEDYDIANDFNETDHIIDLFAEIEKAYKDEPSIFDNISQDDLIFAFFPCVRFENQIMLGFRGQKSGMKDWKLREKMGYCLKLQDELTKMYNLVNELFIVCLNRNLRMIMENPYSEEHYLRRYWCNPATLIDKDRRERGDYFKKPTQYWFTNCEPEYNFIFGYEANNALDCKNALTSMKKNDYEKMNAKNCKVARSMMHPDYANRFIREFIL